MSSSHERRPIVVTHEDSHRFTAQIGPHRITIDQPQRSGGEDAGPGPLELLGASLGSCVAFYVRQFCVARALPCDGLQVEVMAHGGVLPSRIARFDVHVLLPPEMPDQFIPLVERVARTCPAHNTFTHGAEVGVVVESIASTAQQVAAY